MAISGEGGIANTFIQCSYTNIDSSGWNIGITIKFVPQFEFACPNRLNELLKSGRKPDLYIQRAIECKDRTFPGITIKSRDYYVLWHNRQGGKFNWGCPEINDATLELSPHFYFKPSSFLNLQLRMRHVEMDSVETIPVQIRVDNDDMRFLPNDKLFDYTDLCIVPQFIPEEK